MQDAVSCKNVPPCKTFVLNPSCWQQEGLLFKTTHQLTSQHHQQLFALILHCWRCRSEQCAQTTRHRGSDSSWAYKQVFFKKRHFKCNRFQIIFAQSCLLNVFLSVAPAGFCKGFLVQSGMKNLIAFLAVGEDTGKTQL